MKLKPYPSYQDSGLEWLGQIPVNWDLCSIKHRYQVIGGSTPKSDEPTFWDGDIFWVTPADLSKLNGLSINESIRTITLDGLNSCGTSLVPAGSIILSTRAPIGSIGIASTELCTNQGCKSLVPKGKECSRFLTYLLSVSTEELNIRGRGTTFLELSADELCAFKVSFPNDTEQNGIANFLDRETAKLDSLIAKQEKLIECINERIIATVMTAMTSVETQYVRFVYACEVISRPVNQALNDSFVRLGVLNRGRGLFKREETDSEDMGDSDFFWVKKGDLILSGQFAWEGSVAIAEDEHDECVVSHRFPIINGKSGVASTEYLLALLMSPHGDFLLNENSRGSAGRNRPLNLNLLLKEKIPIASIAVQNEVTKLMTLRRKLIEKAQRSIELAKEHRTALISAAVTGKIDVREAS